MDAPVPAGVPPQEPVYQCQTAPPDNVPFTCSVAVPPVQIADAPLTDTGLIGVAITFTTVLTQPEKQFPF